MWTYTLGLGSEGLKRSSGWGQGKEVILWKAKGSEERLRIFSFVFFSFSLGWEERLDYDRSFPKHAHVSLQKVACNFKLFFFLKFFSFISTHILKIIASFCD